MADRFAIKAEIGRRGSSMAALAKSVGLDPSSVSYALQYPVPAANRAIADFLGKSVHELWPEWFDKAGERRPEVSSATLRRRGSSQKRKAA